MKNRMIQGLSKLDFANSCFALADKNNPGWAISIVTLKKFKQKDMWASPSSISGFGLSKIGSIFFEDALGVDPYIIKATNFKLISSSIVRLDKYMPWPYRIEKLENIYLYIYSSEVAVWAAMYDNNLDKLLEIYEESEK